MKFTKEDIFTIPNILSFLRILMIPGIVVLYCVYQEYMWATALIVLSGITDVVDGRIKFTDKGFYVSNTILAELL